LDEEIDSIELGSVLAGTSSQKLPRDGCPSTQPPSQILGTCRNNVHSLSVRLLDNSAKTGNSDESSSSFTVH